jgi:hypothetical protein
MKDLTAFRVIGGGGIPREYPPWPSSGRAGEFFPRVPVGVPGRKKYLRGCPRKCPRSAIEKRKESFRKKSPEAIVQGTVHFMHRQ